MQLTDSADRLFLDERCVSAHNAAVALFSSKIVGDALLASDRQPTSDEIAAAAEWAHRASDAGLDLQNESQLEQEFNRLIVQCVLGYRTSSPGTPGTMRVKQPIPGGTIVDLALGHFDDGGAVITAPFELKGPKVRLDRIMPGRNKTPVQQAWDYAMDAPGARWVLLSDMREIRLYAFGHGRQEYERFELKRLGEAEELRRLQLLLRSEQLLGGPTQALLRKSAEADRDITDALYRDYRSLREDLLQFVRDQRTEIAPLARIEIVQRLLDRLLFIAFAEDSFLLPENSLKNAIEFHDPYHPRPKWNQVTRLFQWVDEGAAAHNIPPYNGGLFRGDATLDGLALPDHLVDRFALLAGYDFRSEVSVTILGHLFEQSISDIEELQAEARQQSVQKAGKRKREGVVYTPEFVTRFIVEQTIGKHLSEISAELLPAFGKQGPEGDIKWKNKNAEADYWRAYLDRLAALRIVDPACGSGAFLVAAFDYLHIEQRRVRTRLGELAPGLLVHAEENADVDIITNNLFGVDLNAESVELTKLSLWLKTAKRNRPLESLDGNIQCGNSLIADEAFTDRPFDWRNAFPHILHGGADQGFDIVLGNPPYVRMELLKSEKPYLEAHYAVVSDRADLYAYFFELGAKLLRPGGRMGFISSSSFFRTGSGAPLRAFLAEQTQIETVVDFGELQVFEGVTTYPAIVTLRKHAQIGAGNGTTLSYLAVKALPDDLSKAFESDAKTMPRTRLGRGSWRLESDMLEAIRQKMAAGRPTLAETFGTPLYGIKTGLNAAFILDRAQRDALVARDVRSVDLLKPFLMGEHLKRWHVESDDLWLIYTPKNRVDIDDYQAIRDHLLPWKDRLEARATKQNWWELQQAQAAYEPFFEGETIIWRDISKTSTFSWMSPPKYLDCTCFFLPDAPRHLMGFLGSKCFWFQLAGMTPIARGGYNRLKAQYVAALHPCETESLSASVETASLTASKLADVERSALHRLADLHSEIEHIPAFGKWPDFSFPELQALLKKRCKVSIPISERDEWERWFDARKAEVSALRARIADAEAEIDAQVYRLFDLSPTEIAAIEDALALASPALGLKAYEAISAVEGLELSEEGRERVQGSGSTSDRRASVSRAYAA